MAVCTAGPGFTRKGGNFPGSYIQIIPQTFRWTINACHPEPAQTVRDLAIEAQHTKVKRRDQPACDGILLPRLQYQGFVGAMRENAQRPTLNSQRSIKRKKKSG